VRVIYTYKQTKQGHHKGFTKRGIQLMRLSVQSANRFYTTHVYCDKESAKLFRLNKIPFTEIVVVGWLDDYEFPNWGLAKLETMKHQIEPYIHIDFDTIITQELQISNDNIIWGYAEVNFNNAVRDGRLTHDLITYVNDNYLMVAKEYETYSEFNYLYVINASLVIVTEPYPIKDIIIELHNRISNYKNIISSKMNMFIEQFMFYQLVKNKNHITHSILSESKYNDLTLFWINEINNIPNIIESFYNNKFIHWPQMDMFTEFDFDKVYVYLLNKLELNDLRDIRIITHNENLI